MCIEGGNLYRRWQFIRKDNSELIDLMGCIKTGKSTKCRHITLRYIVDHQHASKTCQRHVPTNFGIPVLIQPTGMSLYVVVQEKKEI